jgi:hypothetical protein
MGRKVNRLIPLLNPVNFIYNIFNQRWTYATLVPIFAILWAYKLFAEVLRKKSCMYANLRFRSF